MEARGRKTERQRGKGGKRDRTATERANRRVAYQPWARDAAICAGLCLIAVVVRVLFLRGTIDKDLPFSIFYYGDSRVYREYALAILGGQVYDNGIPFHPPLFAWVLSRVIAGVGENPYAMRAALATLASITAPLTYLLGLRLWNRAVGLTGALLSVFSFGLCVTAVSANVEAIYVPMLVGQALLLVLLGDALAEEGRPGRIRWLTIANGLLLGAATLTRAEHLLLMPVVPAVLLLRRPWPELRRILKVSAIVIGTALLVIAPWTVRNAVTLSRFNHAHPELVEPLPVFVLVSNYGALNFALANASGADGAFKPDLIVKGTGSDQMDFGDARQLGLYLHGYREGLGYLLHHPGAGALLIARKIGIALDAGSLGYGMSNWPGGLAGTRRAVDLFTPDSKLMLPVNLLLLAAGVWFSRGLWRRGGALWLMTLHKLVMCAAFFGYVRLFVHLVPFACLVQASALVALVSLLRAVGARRAVAVVGLALAGLSFLELWNAPSHPRNFTASGSSDSTGKIIQDAPIRIAPVP